MRLMTFTLAAGGLVALAVLSSCSGDGGPPRAGDTVRPVLAAGLHWTAGRPGDLRIRLEAENADGSGPRLLSNRGIPTESDPVAKITFFAGQQPLTPVAVTLSHRC
jgi:hypothetical protein